LSAEFPLRPLTVGEVLDAGAAVLRRQPLVLLVAAVLAAGERAVLHQWSGLDPHVRFLDGFLHRFGDYWALFAVGMGTEAFIIGILGGLTAPAAVGMVTSGGVRLRSRWLSIVVTSAVIGAVAAGTFFAGGIAWVAWFMLTSLAIPTLVVDGGVAGPRGRLRNPFGLFARAVKLGSRGLLGGRVRLLAYLPWQLVRLLLLSVGGGEAVAKLLSITSDTAVTTIDWTLWIALNALCYATIAGGDAAAHLETRIRTEGLDIAVGRAVRTGSPVEPVLAVPR
jgi:hypothetical protein